jgi:hypothetical protein
MSITDEKWDRRIRLGNYLRCRQAHRHTEHDGFNYVAVVQVRKPLFIRLISTSCSRPVEPKPPSEVASTVITVKTFLSTRLLPTAFTK